VIVKGHVLGWAGRWKKGYAGLEWKERGVVDNFGWGKGEGRAIGKNYGVREYLGGYSLRK